MSEQTFNNPIPGLKHALEQTSARVRQTSAREAWYGLLWRWLALVAGLFVLDLLLGLPVWLRWAGLMGQAGVVLGSLCALLTRRAGVWGGGVAGPRLVGGGGPGVGNGPSNAGAVPGPAHRVPAAGAS